MGKSYNRQYWGRYHVSKRQQLTGMFAGIDKDIEKVFFSLDEEALNLLLKIYGARHGQNAERYARKSYSKWKNGTTKLSGQTAERLLNLIPLFLPEDVRYELTKKLRERHRAKAFKVIRTTHQDWFNDVIPVLAEVVSRSEEFKFSDALIQKAGWLLDLDIERANKILTAIEKEEAKISLNKLDVEFLQLHYIVQNVAQTTSVKHRIEIPQGTVEIYIERQKQTFFQRLTGDDEMANESKGLASQKSRTMAVSQNRGPNLLDTAMEQLDPEERKRILAKALEERLKLDSSAANADERHHQSSREMEDFVDRAVELDQRGSSDYTYNQTFKTASGESRIEVKKNNNTVIIVVAVVIGLVLLAFFSQ